MAELSRTLDPVPATFPLSSPQRLWYSGDMGDEGGFFCPRFTMVSALRIAGHVAVAALQDALDDVVARHEILRTVLVRDVQPPHQRVHPPEPVPLLVRDLPPTADRDAQAEQVLGEAEQASVNPSETPLLRAVLSRFDDEDSVLTVITHHTASDEWSMQVILRDLAACYAARVAGTPADLPPAGQYRDFTAWQAERASGPRTGTALAYWRERMHGARIFAAPTDRAVPEVHSRPYSARYFTVDSDVLAPLARLAANTGTTTAVVLLAAFKVLAHRISGSTDLAIDTLVTGRGDDRRFENTAGSLMNFLVFRTDFAPCASFRHVVAATRDTVLEALSHEVPIQAIEGEVPELMAPNDEDRTTSCILGIFQPPFDAVPRIAGGSYEIHRRDRMVPVGPWIPHGVAWALHLLPAGELSGCVQFNGEELDEATVAGWVSSLRRILAGAAGAPDRAWRKL